jgi:WD40 repeat protein
MTVLSSGYLATGGLDNMIYVWDTTLITPNNTIIPLYNCTGHTQGISSLTVSLTGSLISGSFDTSIRIWSSSGTVTSTLSGHTQAVNALAILPSSGYIVSASDDQTVTIWSAAGLSLFNLTGHTLGVNSVAVFSTGYIASGSWDKTVKIWNGN